MSVICLATSSRRSAVRAASTRSAPASAHRRASVVPSAGPDTADDDDLVLQQSGHLYPSILFGDLSLPHRDSRAPVLFGDLVALVVRQRRGHLVDVDQLDRRAVGLGELARHPLPAELQESLAVAEGLDPVRHAGVLVGDHDADLAVRIRLGLSAVQRGLVVDVVQRDVPQAAELEAEVGRVGDRQRDDQRLVVARVRSVRPTSTGWPVRQASAAARPSC